MTGTYYLQSNKAAFNQNMIDPTCLVCKMESETLEHFLLDCNVLAEKREPYISELNVLIKECHPCVESQSLEVSKIKKNKKTSKNFGHL